MAVQSAPTIIDLITPKGEVAESWEFANSKLAYEYLKANIGEMLQHKYQNKLKIREKLKGEQDNNTIQIGDGVLSVDGLWYLVRDIDRENRERATVSLDYDYDWSTALYMDTLLASGRTKMKQTFINPDNGETYTENVMGNYFPQLHSKYATSEVADYDSLSCGDKHRLNELLILIDFLIDLKSSSEARDLYDSLRLS